MTNFSKRLEVFRNLLIGAAFPAFALSLLVCWEVFLIAMLLAPSSASGLGAFADDFRIWCFGYDPATGSTELAYVMAMIVPQFMIGAFIAYFWWEPLRELSRQPRIIARYLGAAALLVAGSSVGFALTADQAPKGELPFPGRSRNTRCGSLLQTLRDRSRPKEPAASRSRRPPSRRAATRRTPGRRSRSGDFEKPLVVLPSSPFVIMAAGARGPPSEPPRGRGIFKRSQIPPARLSEA